MLEDDKLEEVEVVEVLDLAEVTTGVEMKGSVEDIEEGWDVVEVLFNTAVSTLVRLK